MDRDLQRQKNAVILSICKWETIIGGGTMDFGPINCECCKEYLGNRVDNFGRNKDAFIGCVGCPIAEDVGKPECKGTPYEAWVKHFDSINTFVRKVTDDKTKALAQDELDYLKGLLKKLTKVN